MRSKFVKRHLIKVNFGCYGVLKIKFQHIQKQPLEVLFFFQTSKFFKQTPTQVFFCEICDIFKNNHFE